MAETVVLSREDRIALAQQAHAEGRIIQNAWRRNDGGRELVCALAAFGQDINGAKDCPADLMPQWLAELVPAIDDGIPADRVPWFSGELIARAQHWHKLDDAAWERVRTGVLIASIKQALDVARPVQPDPLPEYWTQVTSAIDAVATALQTGIGIQEADAAAWAAARAAGAAAEAAAWAAGAAAEAAAWAAGAAAVAAAWAAGAAAEAAAWVAGAAAGAAAEAAAWAAEAATWVDIAAILFKMVDAELEAAQTDA